MSSLPTHSLLIRDRENAMGEMLEFAQALIDEGQRPWFEVRYPAPEWLSPEDQEQWLDDQENLNGEGTWDAVELVNGELVTLPPYSELLEG